MINFERTLVFALQNGATAKVVQERFFLLPKIPSGQFVFKVLSQRFALQRIIHSNYYCREEFFVYSEWCIGKHSACLSFQRHDFLFWRFLHNVPRQSNVHLDSPFSIVKRFELPLMQIIIHARIYMKTNWHFHGQEWTWTISNVSIWGICLKNVQNKFGLGPKQIWSGTKKVWSVSMIPQSLQSVDGFTLLLGVALHAVLRVHTVIRYLFTDSVEHFNQSQFPEKKHVRLN